MSNTKVWSDWILLYSVNNEYHTNSKQSIQFFSEIRVTLCVNAMMAPTVVTRNHSFNTLQMVSSPFFALVQKTFQYFCVQRHLQTFPPFPDARLFTVWHVDPPWFQISGCADTGQGRKRAVLNFDLEPFLSSTRNNEATSRGRVARRSTSFKLE